MRIHWFSPLLPLPTDIGHYTGRVLPPLARLADVTLWTDQDDWDPALEAYAPVRRFRPDRVPWAELNAGDATFYNIGNNAQFHRSIWDVSRHHPGVVILHDVRLVDFFEGVFRPMWAGREAFLGLMERCFGAEGKADGERWWRDRSDPASRSEKYPMTGFAMQGALGALLHSEFAAELLRRYFAGPSIVAPLPYRASPKAREATRGARGSGPPHRLALFGYIGRNRGLDFILEALAGFGEAGLFRLDVFGQLWDPDHLASRTRELGLQGLVSYRGFVPESELDEALDASDLAFNLRSPTMGESSASQLRIWDHSLASIVTRIGVYADLPESAVVFVEPGDEVRGIRGHLRSFLDDPARFARMGAEGRRILDRDHSPDAYAAELIRVVREFPYLRRRFAAFELAERVGSEVGGWCGDDATDLLCGRLGVLMQQMVGGPGGSAGRPGVLPEARWLDSPGSNGLSTRL